jgi:hypothetical protein
MKRRRAPTMLRCWLVEYLASLVALEAGRVVEEESRIVFA